MAEPEPPEGETADDAPFTYESHLRLDRLLEALRPITDHPEEHLFITTHHVVELWMRQILFDGARAIDDLDGDMLARGTWLLSRLGAVLALLEAHWPVLETMSAADFHEFRPALGSASGLQSRQFREMEVLFGLPEVAGPAYVERVERAWPGLVGSHPRTLRRAVLDVFERDGTGLAEAYRRRWEVPALFALAEAAVELDRRFASWRHGHVMMVRRQIGMRTRGTGGTVGRDYLSGTLDLFVFPELWETRHALAAAAGGAVTGGARS